MYLTIVYLGALTSKVSAYKYRSWELEIREVLDYFDSLGVIGNSCVKGLKIVRIIPGSNLFFDWISDKFRFSFDSLLVDRFTRILYKQEELSLFESLQKGALPIIEASSIYFFLGKTLDMIDSIYIKNFTKICSKVNYITDSFFNLCNSNLDERVLNYMNFGDLVNVKNLVIWGIDLRLELPVLESFFLRKYTFEGVYSIGSLEPLGFNIGNNFLSHLCSFVNGTTLLIKTLLKKSVLILGGAGLFGRCLHSDLGNDILLYLNKLKTIFFKKNSFGFSMINLFMSDLNIMEVGLRGKSTGGVYYNDRKSLIFVVDNFDIVFLEKYNFSICFNSYNSIQNVYFCDLVLPIVFVPEKNYITTNLQGSLTYCEKIIKNKLINLNITNYLVYFVNIFLLNFTLRTSVKFNKKISNNIFINLLLGYINLNKNITMFKTYLYKRSLNISLFKKDLVYLVSCDISLQNIISNYFYTHMNLLYSPTILLADARLINRNITFF
jgi:hypothetical protein